MDLNLPSVGPDSGSTSTAAPSVAPLDIFKDAPGKLSSGLQQVQQNQTAYSGVVDAVTKAMPEIQAKKLENLTTTVNNTDAINSTARDTVAAAADRMKPIFATQAAIDARRQEVAQMNPFKRAVMGLVNPLYNESHLATLHDVNQSSIQDAVQEYTDTADTAAKLVGYATAHGAGQEQILNMQQEGLDTQLKLAATALENSRSQVRDTITGIQGVSELDRAQQQLANTALDGLTLQTIGAAMADAKKNGKAIVGGVPIPAGLIQSRMMQLQGQSNALESQQLAIAAGRLNLADAHDRSFVQHMSPGDLTEAANNGGNFRGHQLPMQLIAEGLQANNSRLASLGQLGTIESQAKMSMSALDGFMATTHQVQAKAVSMFGGNIPAPLKQFYTAKANEIQGTVEKLNAIKDPQAKKMALAQFAQQIQGSNDELSGAIDKAVAGYTKDPAGRMLMKGFLTGADMNPSDVTAGTIAFIKQGGLPPGVKLNGADAAAFAAAKQVYVQATHAAESGQGTPSGKPMHGKDAEDFVKSHVADAITTAWSNAHGNALMNSIIPFAQSQNHPFGQVNPSDFQAARVAGDSTGLTKLAASLSITPQQLQQYVSGGGSPDIAKKVQVDSRGQTIQGRDPGTLRSQLTSIQNAEMLHALDSSSSARPGFVPSRAFADFMQSGAFQDAAGRHIDAQGNSNLGGFIGSTIAGGSMRGNIYNQGQAIVNQVAMNTAEGMKKQQAVLANYGNDPVKRVGAILGAIPGIGQHEEAVLMSHLQTAAQQAPRGMSATDAMINLIKGGGGKFQDPGLEKTRKIAAANFDAAAQATDSAMDRLANPMHAFLPFQPGGVAAGN